MVWLVLDFIDNKIKQLDILIDGGLILLIQFIAMFICLKPIKILAYFKE